MDTMPKIQNIRQDLGGFIGWIFEELLRNKLRFTWGWAEVLSMAFSVKLLNWMISSIMCMNRGARPKVSLRWQYLSG